MFGSGIIDVGILPLPAPFWFDMLNKIINLRLAGKKPEKTTTALGGKDKTK